MAKYRREKITPTEVVGIISYALTMTDDKNGGRVEFACRVKADSFNVLCSSMYNLL